MGSSRGGTSRRGASRGRHGGNSRIGIGLVREVDAEVNNEFEELDKEEIEEQRQVVQIQEFFEVSRYPTLIRG